MKNHCRDCKFWEDQNDETICMVIDGQKIGSCFQLNKVLWNGDKTYKTINKVVHVLTTPSENPNYTMECFGCNLFQLRKNINT